MFVLIFNLKVLLWRAKASIPEATMLKVYLEYEHKDNEHERNMTNHPAERTTDNDTASSF